VFQETGTSARAENVIRIQGAREHNLKNISLTIPRDKFVVITGVSGSGKSTLAFDLLFSEGQRRFLDSMNLYARQFVEQLARPEVDLITGIPPTVSIEQRVSRGGGKSTVATVTEVFHFVRLLFARLGTQYCPTCNIPVQAQTRDELTRKLHEEMHERGDLLLLGPVVKNRKGFHTDVAEWALKHDYEKIRADGKICETDQPFRLDRFREHDVEIVIGTLTRKTEAWSKTPQQLIDEALKIGGGILYALGKDKKLSVHSVHRACPKCNTSFAVLDPKNFSYNSPQGWCPTCRGFGEIFYLPDVDRGARADAIEESWFGWQEGERELCSDCQGARLNPLARAVRLQIADATSSSADRRKTRDPLELSPTIVDIGNATVEHALHFLDHLKFKGREAEIARDILPEIRERLKFLNKVGLGYLQLGRSATTLSGGEAQRIRLAAQLGSNLTGVLYILDEPTIGLHARDNERLLAALDILKRRGNSLVVVEHDEETMRRADYVIDLGPAAGVNGGQVVAAGTLRELKRNSKSITGQCLREKKCFPHRGERRPVTAGHRRSNALQLRGAALHNLKNLTLSFPLHRFVTVTGVSGSGKSTLIHDCLIPALKAKLEGAKPLPEIGQVTAGHGLIKAVYEVDQSPIGRTPRSIPATYVGFFDEIRQLFAQIPEARLRGYTASRFSFNSAQGRCPDCQGAGTIKLEMNFLPPAFVRCETCEGCRFERETLDIQLNGKNIAQVLELSVAEAIEFFSAFQKIRRPLEALRDTGLDYLKLGQTSPTLSGGEAQRLKLVTHLLSGFRTPRPEIPGRKGADSAQLAIDLASSKTSNNQLPMVNRQNSNLFILEEPTIGLHMADVRRLVDVLQRLVDAGHSVIVIEHNLDLIAESDWVIDLGPDGGAGGGEIIAQGTPEEIASHRESHTGRFLRSILRK
jgi:excinuclease ABC subunit A